MDEGLFKIIFLGGLVEAEKRGVVSRSLAALFGSTAGAMDTLFDRSPVLLKKNLSRDEAIRFRDAIVRCGAYCRIEAMDSAESASEDKSALAGDKPGERFSCPRCGEPQDKSPLCRYCGALIQEYQVQEYRELTDVNVAVQSEVQDEPQEISREELNRRYYERRRDLETAVNVDDHDERRKGRDRRRAHLIWRR